MKEQYAHDIANILSELGQKISRDELDIIQSKKQSTDQPLKNYIELNEIKFPKA